MPQIGVPTEFDVNYSRDRDVPLTVEQKLDIGSKVLTFYIEKALDLPIGTSTQFVATNWLRNIGFDEVEWYQVDDDLLMVHLVRLTTDSVVSYVVPAIDNFMLVFSGWDSAIITLFDYAGHQEE